jgi:hypothetical protein
MDIVITRLTPDRHRLRVERDDGTVDEIELGSRSFLLHDLAHLAVETEVGIGRGYWGSVAGGGALTGTGLSGGDIALAESLAGPVQTLMRTAADVAAYVAVSERTVPALVQERPDLPHRLHDRARRLRGHLRGTPFGSEMRVSASFDDPAA